MSQLLIDQRIQLPHGVAHLKVWQLGSRVTGSLGSHSYKYRLVYLEGEWVRVLYDVHTGKPDHKHIDGLELPYTFATLQQLAADFFNDIEALLR